MSSNEPGTIDIEGMGELTKPSELDSRKKSGHATKRVLPNGCPVRTCSHFSPGAEVTFKELRGHFGKVAAGRTRECQKAHEEYELTKERFKEGQL